MNVSLARALVQPVTSPNTYFLMGALACAAWWSGPRRPAAALDPGRPDRLVAAALGGLIVVSAFGAAASLASTVFPAESFLDRRPQRLRGRRPLPDPATGVAPGRGRRLRHLSRLAGTATRTHAAGRPAGAVSSRGGGLRDGAGPSGFSTRCCWPPLPSRWRTCSWPTPSGSASWPFGSSSVPSRPRSAWTVLSGGTARASGRGPLGCPVEVPVGLQRIQNWGDVFSSRDSRRAVSAVMRRFPSTTSLRRFAEMPRRCAASDCGVERLEELLEQHLAGRDGGSGPAGISSDSPRCRHRRHGRSPTGTSRGTGR